MDQETSTSCFASKVLLSNRSNLDAHSFEAFGRLSYDAAVSRLFPASDGWEPVLFDASSVVLDAIQPLTRVFRNVSGSHFVYTPTDIPFGVSDTELWPGPQSAFDDAWFALPVGVRHGVLTEPNMILRSRCSESAWGTVLMAFEHITSQFPLTPLDEPPTFHPVLWSLGAHIYTSLSPSERAELETVVSAERFHLSIPAMLSFARSRIDWT